jgi:hypothetical protein
MTSINCDDKHGCMTRDFLYFGFDFAWLVAVSIVILFFFCVYLIQAAAAHGNNWP